MRNRLSGVMVRGNSSWGGKGVSSHSEAAWLASTQSGRTPVASPGILRFV